MRQGNVFSQWVNRYHEIADGRQGNNDAWLRVPWELQEEWSKYKTVDWVDNRDGTFTLIPKETT